MVFLNCSMLIGKLKKRVHMDVAGVGYMNEKDQAQVEEDSNVRPVI